MLTLHPWNQWNVHCGQPDTSQPKRQFPRALHSESYTTAILASRLSIPQADLTVRPRHREHDNLLWFGGNADVHSNLNTTKIIKWSCSLLPAEKSLAQLPQSIKKTVNSQKNLHEWTTRLWDLEAPMGLEEGTLTLWCLAKQPVGLLQETSAPTQHLLVGVFNPTGHG